MGQGEIEDLPLYLVLQCNAGIFMEPKVNSMLNICLIVKEIAYLPAEVF